MNLLSNRAEQALKQIIKFENKIKNRKISKYFSAFKYRKFILGKDIKKIPFFLSDFWTRDNNLTLKKNKKKIRATLYEYRKLTVFDVFKRTSEFFLSARKSISDNDKAGIYAINFRKKWEDFFKDNGFGNISVCNGSGRFVTTNFYSCGFLFGYRVELDIFNEFKDQSLVCEMNKQTDWNTTNYSKIALILQEMGDEEPYNTHKYINSLGYSYFKNKNKELLFPKISIGLSILAILISIILPIFLSK